MEINLVLAGREISLSLQSIAMSKHFMFSQSWEVSSDNDICAVATGWKTTACSNLPIIHDWPWLDRCIDLLPSLTA